MLMLTAPPAPPPAAPSPESSQDTHRHLRTARDPRRAAELMTRTGYGPACPEKYVSGLPTWAIDSSASATTIAAGYRFRTEGREDTKLGQNQHGFDGIHGSTRTTDHHGRRTLDTAIPKQMREPEVSSLAHHLRGLDKARKSRTPEPRAARYGLRAASIDDRPAVSRLALRATSVATKSAARDANEQECDGKPAASPSGGESIPPG